MFDGMDKFIRFDCGYILCLKVPKIGTLSRVAYASTATSFSVPSQIPCFVQYPCATR